jgi:hypothetical protein
LQTLLSPSCTFTTTTPGFLRVALKEPQEQQHPAPISPISTACRGGAAAWLGRCGSEREPAELRKAELDLRGGNTYISPTSPPPSPQHQLLFHTKVSLSPLCQQPLTQPHIVTTDVYADALEAGGGISKATKQAKPPAAVSLPTHYSSRMLTIADARPQPARKACWRPSSLWWSNPPFGAVSSATSYSCLLLTSSQTEASSVASYAKASRLKSSPTL